MNRRHLAGFTLFEVLAALVLLALLMLGVYAGIRAATRSVRVGEAVIERLDDVRATQNFLRRELQQALALPFARAADGGMVYFTGTPTQLRFVAPLPGYLNARGPQLQQLTLEPNGHGALQLVERMALLPPDGSAPRALGQPQVLLDGIRDGHFAYRGRDDDDRPTAWLDNWPGGHRLPLLIDVRLRLVDGTAWPELDIPLRIDPSASQNGALLLQGLNGSVP